MTSSYERTIECLIMLELRCVCVEKKTSMNHASKLSQGLPNEDAQICNDVSLQCRVDFSRCFCLRHLLIAHHLLKDDGYSSCLSYLIHISMGTQSLFMISIQQMNMPTIKQAISNLFDSLIVSKFNVSSFQQFIEVSELSKHNIVMFNHIPVFTSPFLNTPKLEYLLALVFVALHYRQRLLILVSGDALIQTVASLLQQRLANLHQTRQYLYAQSSGTDDEKILITTFYSNDSTQSW